MRRRVMTHDARARPRIIGEWGKCTASGKVARAPLMKAPPGINPAGRYLVHPPSNRCRKPIHPASSGRVTLQHTPGTTYRCYLPVLTGFIGCCCTGPSHQHRLGFTIGDRKALRWEFNPGIADSGLQGTASSPSSTIHFLTRLTRKSPRIRRWNRASHKRVGGTIIAKEPKAATMAAKTVWSRWGSNPRPPRCERGALPAELLPRRSRSLIFARPTRGVEHPICLRDPSLARPRSF